MKKVILSEEELQEIRRVMKWGGIRFITVKGGAGEKMIMGGTGR